MSNETTETKPTTDEAAPVEPVVMQDKATGMTDDELMNAMDGLFAYDTGATDTGIKDEELRERVIKEIHKDISRNQLFSSRLSRLARELYLTDDAINAGYGLEAINSFAEWIDDCMRPSA